MHGKDVVIKIPFVAIWWSSARINQESLTKDKNRLTIKINMAGIKKAEIYLSVFILQFF